MILKRQVFLVMLPVIITSITNLYAQGDTRMMPGIYRSQSTEKIILIKGMSNPYTVIVTDNNRTIYAKGTANVDDLDVSVRFENGSSVEWFFSPFDRLCFVNLSKSNIIPQESEFRHSGALGNFSDLFDNSATKEPITVTLFNIPQRFLGKTIGMVFMQNRQQVAQDMDSKFGGSGATLDKNIKTFQMLDNSISSASGIEGFFLTTAGSYLVGFLIFDPVTKKTSEAWSNLINIRAGDNAVDFSILSRN